MKKWITGILCFLMITALSGFRIGEDPSQEWEGQWYGWYRMADTSGEYESYRNLREDCIGEIELPDSHKGSLDGTISLYDAQHDEQPFLVLSARFSKDTVVLQDGGRLEEDEIVKQDLDIRTGNDLDLETGLWMEGTIETTKGKLHIQILMMPIEAEDAWHQLQEKQVDLPLTKEELLPEFYENCYLKVKENNGFSIQSYFASLHGLKEEAVKIDWLKNVETKGEMQFYRYDHASDFSQIVTCSDTTLYDMRFEKVTKREDEYDEEILNETKVLDSNVPKVFQITFHTDAPEYGIRCRDILGREYFYLINVNRQEESIGLQRMEVKESNGEDDMEIEVLDGNYTYIDNDILMEMLKGDWECDNPALEMKITEDYHLEIMDGERTVLSSALSYTFLQPGPYQDVDLRLNGDKLVLADSQIEEIQGFYTKMDFDDPEHSELIMEVSKEDAYRELHFTRVLKKQ